jgi:glucokinase
MGQGLCQLYEAVAAQERDQRVGMSSARINAIGKAFNHAGNNKARAARYFFCKSGQRFLALPKSSRIFGKYILS